MDQLPSYLLFYPLLELEQRLGEWQSQKPQWIFWLTLHPLLAMEKV
ncbi:hypothetical protein NG796_08965 [Laspinema sp. A4]|nr:hypothetical protein [Laspinema sp. D2d]MCT7983424.1 hypothetical protein [Laspinema sp. D2d]